LGSKYLEYANSEVHSESLFLRLQEYKQDRPDHKSSFLYCFIDGLAWVLADEGLLQGFGRRLDGALLQISFNFYRRGRLLLLEEGPILNIHQHDGWLAHLSLALFQLGVFLFSIFLGLKPGLV